MGCLEEDSKKDIKENGEKFTRSRVKRFVLRRYFVFIKREPDKEGRSIQILVFSLLHETRGHSAFLPPHNIGDLHFMFNNYWIRVSYEVNSFCSRFRFQLPRSAKAECNNCIYNRPLAASHSGATNPPCWRAKVALGQDKQRKLPFQVITVFCSSFPSTTFALKRGGFVPREWLAAKGILSIPNISKLLTSLVLVDVL